MTFRWYSSANSATGQVRSINEDAYLSNDTCGLWAVADGMGGHDHGDIAAKMLIESLTTIQPASSVQQLAAATEQQVRRANTAIIEHAANNSQIGSMGTTLAALLIHGDNYVCMWSGDSRVYLHRQGVLTRLTHDHSVVQELIDNGEILACDAELHPASNQITSAVGVSEDLRIDKTEGILRDEDTFLICSDGIYREVNEAEISNYLAYSPNSAVNSMASLTEQRGARDNHTQIVTRIEQNTLIGQR